MAIFLQLFLPENTCINRVPLDMSLLTPVLKPFVPFSCVVPIRDLECAASMSSEQIVVAYGPDYSGPPWCAMGPLSFSVE